MNAAFLDALGVKGHELARAAGYDNIENLLADAGETLPVVFGVTTLRRIADPGAPVKMCGCDYIEAQLHGPISFSRDIEEMRVPSDEIRSHYRRLYEADSSIAGGMGKDEWIESKTAADTARLVQFGKDNGFKVTFYGAGEVSLDGPDRDSLREDIEEAKNILRPHSREFAKSLFVGEDLAEIINAKFKDLSDDRRGAVERAFGVNFVRAPESVIALFGGECEKVIGDIDDPTKEGMHDRSSIRYSAEGHVLASMEHIADGILAAEENGVKDPVKLSALIKAAVGAGVKQPRIRVFVVAQIARDHIAPDLVNLVNDALAEELAGRVDEVAAMGLGNKFAVGGQALALLLQLAVESLVGNDAHCRTIALDAADLNGLIRLYLGFAAKQRLQLACRVHIALTEIEHAVVVSEQCSDLTGAVTEFLRVFRCLRIGEQLFGSEPENLVGHAGSRQEQLLLRLLRLGGDHRGMTAAHLGELFTLHALAVLLRLFFRLTETLAFQLLGLPLHRLFLRVGVFFDCLQKIIRFVFWHLSYLLQLDADGVLYVLGDTVLGSAIAVTVGDLDDQRLLAVELEVIDDIRTELDELFRHQNDGDILAFHRLHQFASDLFLLMDNDALYTGETHAHFGVDIITDQIKFHNLSLSRAGKES